MQSFSYPLITLEKPSILPKFYFFFLVLLGQWIHRTRQVQAANESQDDSFSRELIFYK
jgi:hypothetical protein